MLKVRDYGPLIMGSLALKRCVGVGPYRSGELIVPISSRLCIQGHYAGSLRLARIEVFSPQKWATATDQELLSGNWSFNIYQHLNACHRVTPVSIDYVTPSFSTFETKN